MRKIAFPIMVEERPLTKPGGDMAYAQVKKTADAIQKANGTNVFISTSSIRPGSYFIDRNVVLPQRILVLHEGVYSFLEYSCEKESSSIIRQMPYSKQSGSIMD